MTLWLVAVLAGLLGAAAQYARRSLQPRVLPLALARAGTVTIVVALLLGAPARPASPPRPDVALDASQSWLRAAPDCVAWTAAIESAVRSGGTISRFGDSLRADDGRAAPGDQASGLRAVVDRAAATGRPVVLITDGELDDADALTQLPGGSRAVVTRCAPAPDVAVASIDVPQTLLAGDTVAATINLASGGAGGPAGELELRLDDKVLAALPVAASAPFAERSIVLRGVAGGGERGAVLRAVFRGSGDRERRNDTLAIGVDVTRAPAAVFASTAPDFDAREAVAALRGVTALPTRAYYRVAPGIWRADGTLAAVEERAVREAVREAPMVVLHGDTSAFGPPRRATRAALLLFAPPASDDGEWFVAGAPPSPLAGALAGLPLDSLPPIAVAATMPRGDWVGVTSRQGGSGEARRPVVVGWDAPRRIAVLGASGLWRWRFRGGASSDAYGALAGSLFDWLAAGRSDRRAVVPDRGVIRAGESVRWRRGGTADSAVALTLTLTRRDGIASVDSIRLRFTDGMDVGESTAPSPGIYDVHMEGGSAVLAVNASREMLPRRPTVASGAIGGAGVTSAGNSVREEGWLYALVVLLLCAEWMGRRRAALR